MPRLRRNYLYPQTEEEVDEYVDALAPAAPAPPVRTQPLEARMAAEDIPGTVVPARSGAAVVEESPSASRVSYGIAEDLEGEPSEPQFGKDFAATRDYYKALTEPSPKVEREPWWKQALGYAAGLTALGGTDIPERLIYKGSPRAEAAARQSRLAAFKTMSDLEKEAFGRREAAEKELTRRKELAAELKREEEAGKQHLPKDLIDRGYRKARGSEDPNEMIGDPIRATDGNTYYMPKTYEPRSPKEGLVSFDPLTGTAKTVLEPPKPEPKRGIIGTLRSGIAGYTINPDGTFEVQTLREPMTTGDGSQRRVAKLSGDKEADMRDVESTYGGFRARVEEDYRRLMEGADEDDIPNLERNRQEALQRVNEDLAREKEGIEREYRARMAGEGIDLPEVGYLSTGERLTRGGIAAPPSAPPPPELEPGPNVQLPRPDLGETAPPRTAPAPARPKTYTIAEVNAAAAKLNRDPLELRRQIEAEGGTVVQDSPYSITVPRTEREQPPTYWLDKVKGVR